MLDLLLFKLSHITQTRPLDANDSLGGGIDKKMRLDMSGRKMCLGEGME